MLPQRIIQVSIQTRIETSWSPTETNEREGAERIRATPDNHVEKRKKNWLTIWTPFLGGDDDSGPDAPPSQEGGHDFP